MYKQLSNNGFTIKQHIQQKTGNRHLRHYFVDVRFI